MSNKSINKGKRERKYKLHKAVWKGDLEKVNGYLAKKCDVNEKDLHGNTPLHIAAHFANKDIIDALLTHGANPELLSLPGWRAIDEAISSGAQNCSVVLLEASLAKYRADMENNAPNWNQRLSEIPDFTMDLTWEFSLLGASWIPFVGSFLPNDVYKITKKGNKIRLDYSLKGFQNFKIIRGNVSFIYSDSHLYLLDHDKKTVQDFCEHPGEKYKKNVEDALKYSFAHDCCSHLPLGSDEIGGQPKIEFTPKVGWFSKNISTEDVGDRPCKIYNTSLQFRSLIRSDPHAKQTRIPRSLKSDEDFQDYQQKYKEYFYNATPKENEDGEDHHSHHHAKHPFKNGFIWDSENVIRKVKTFDGSIWITDDYPISVHDFLAIVEIYSPTNQMWKYLQNYISSNLPDGFPVKLEVPVFYVLSALVEFKHLKILSKNDDEDSDDEDLDEDEAQRRKDIKSGEYFVIPENYHKVQEAFIFGQESREMFKVVENNNNKKHKNEK